MASECFVSFLSPWYQTLVRFVLAVTRKILVGPYFDFKYGGD